MKFTVNTLKNHPQMMWGSDFNIYVDKVSKADDYTVVFKLKKPNPRFHYLFTVRYNACYIMPKHIWEKIKNPTEFIGVSRGTLPGNIFKDIVHVGIKSTDEIINKRIVMKIRMFFLNKMLKLRNLLRKFLYY